MWGFKVVTACTVRAEGSMGSSGGRAHVRVHTRDV